MRIKLSILCLFAASIVHAQAPDSLWSRTYGGGSTDVAYSMQQTGDGGYVLAGSTESYGAGGSDIYVVKTDALGDTVWTRTYGGSETDIAYSIQETDDDGYVIAGYTNSFGAGNTDFYVVKTDAQGDTLWTRTYGGSLDESGYSIQQTTDGGYVIAGVADSYGAGEQDFYVVKTDAQGDTLWTRTYGGSLVEYGQSIQQTTDGGYVIAGRTTTFGAGGLDFYVVKTDAQGDTLWTRTYGGSLLDYSQSIQQTADGGYVIAGSTTSFGAGNSDCFVVKTDAQGDTLWTRTYGESGEDQAWSIQQTSDGNCVVAGVTTSFGAGSYDFYLVKTDALGDTLWTRTFGGSGIDYAYSFDQTTDGDYVVAGETNSFGAGSYDFWLVAAREATLVWNNPAGGDWHNPANWTPNVVPTQAYNVDITLAGNYTIGIDAHAECAAIDFGGASGTQTIEIGTESGLYINEGGIINPNAEIHVAGDPSVLATDGLQILHNHGLIQFGEGSTLSLGEFNADFTNESDGTITFIDGVNLTGTATVLRNNGTITKTGYGLLNSEISWHNNVGSTVEFQEGPTILQELVSDALVYFRATSITTLLGEPNVIECGPNGTFYIEEEAQIFGTEFDANIGIRNDLYKTGAGEAVIEPVWELLGDDATGTLHLQEGKLSLTRDDGARFNGPVIISDGAELEVGGGYFEFPSTIASETENTGTFSVNTTATMHITPVSFTFTGNLHLVSGTTELEPSMVTLDTLESLVVESGAVLNSSKTIYTRSFANNGGTVNATVVIVGVDHTWTNDAGGNWNEPTNWSPNTIPTEFDIATIDLGGTYTIDVNGIQKCRDLVLDAGGGTQTLDIHPSGEFYISNSGYVGVNGAVSVSGAGAYLILLGSSFDNHGQMTFAGGSNLDFASGSTFTNASEGAISSSGIVALSGGFTTELASTIQNDGDIVMSGGVLDLHFVYEQSSTGTFTVEAGQVNLYDFTTSGAVTLESGSTMCLSDLSSNNHQIIVDTGGVFELQGTAIVNDCSITTFFANQGEVKHTGSGEGKINVDYQYPGDANTGAINVLEGMLTFDPNSGNIFEGPITIYPDAELYVQSGVFNASSSVISQTESEGIFSLGIGVEASQFNGEFDFTGDLQLLGGDIDFYPSNSPLDTLASVRTEDPTVFDADATIYTWLYINNGGTINADIVVIGEDRNWNNPLGGDWNDPANWTPNEVPTSANDVFIDLDGTYTITISDGFPECYTLTHGAGTGTQTIDIDPAHGLAIHISGYVGTNGHFNLGGGLQLFGLNFENHGVMAFLDGSSLEIGPNGSFTNSEEGVITFTDFVNVHGGIYGDLTSTFLNEGIVVHNGGDYLELICLYTQSNTGSFTLESGNLHIHDFTTDGLVTLATGTMTLLCQFSDNNREIFVDVGGVLELQGTAIIGDCTSLEYLANKGEVKHTGTGEATIYIDYYYPGDANTGEINVLEGKLTFEPNSGNIFRGPITIYPNAEFYAWSGVFMPPSAIYSQTEGAGIFSLGHIVDWTYFTTDFSGTFAFTGDFHLHGGTTNFLPINDPLDTLTSLLIEDPSIFNSSSVIYTRDFEMNGGTANADIVVVEDYVWNGGDLGGDESDSVVVQPGGTLTLSGPDSSSLSGQELLIGGDADLSGSGTLTLDSGSTIVVQDGGTLTVGDSITIESIEGGDTLINNGVMTISSPNDTSFLNVFIWNFDPNNRTPGTIEILSGRTVFGGGANNEGTLALNSGSELILQSELGNGGAVVMGNGSRMVVDDTLNNRADGVLTMEGDAEISGGGRVKNGGQINGGTLTLSITNRHISAELINLSDSGFVDVLADTLTLSGGGINHGDIEIHTGTVLKVSGVFENAADGLIHGNGVLDVTDATFTNNGTISPGASPGILTIKGNVTFGVTSVLNIELNGSIMGQLYDQLNVLGTVQIGGTLHIERQPLYIPADEDSFDILTYSNASGTFANFTGLDLGTGDYLDFEFGPNGIQSYSCRSGDPVFSLASDSIVIEVDTSVTVQQNYPICNTGLCPLGWTAEFSTTTPDVDPWAILLYGMNGVLRGSDCSDGFVMEFSSSSVSPGTYFGIVSVTSNSGNPSNFDVPVRMTVLGEPPCPSPDSVVIQYYDQYMGDSRTRVIFHTNVAGTGKAWVSTIPNSVFPAGFSLIFADDIDAGDWAFLYLTGSHDYARFVVTLDCALESGDERSLGGGFITFEGDLPTIAPVTDPAGSQALPIPPKSRQFTK